MCMHFGVLFARVACYSAANFVGFCIALRTVDAQPARRTQRRTANRIAKMDPQILSANGSNFINVRDDAHWHGRADQPMLLTAWTQTTSEDFGLLRTLDVDPHVEAENRALREKVRYLESKLQEHTDLLSQIHATSARMQQATGTATSPPAHQPQILTPPNSVICAPSSAQSQRSEVIDYKIIASAGADCNDADAIEIRLAAESLNSLSTSADSDRLEICLGNEDQQQQQQIKRESSTPLQLIKRRKLELKECHNNMAAPQPHPQPLQQQQQHLHNMQYKLPARKSNANLNTSAEEWKPEFKTLQQKADNVMVSIGPNNTCVPASVFENINWSVSSLATRKLLVAIFDRETLATHSMTGKPSPAFKDQQKPLKQMLDPLKIQDIIFAVTRKSNASEKEVRNAITTKCADENKMMKIQKGKRCSVGDKENMA
ncbi:protein insensitive isoform X1 [Drosophila navojoa]|uniref:protein insensitive isoform X1 n=1 Tax=Drosophila navojoa TaxID=7232 RepID=UPI0011BF83CF|nr:protein insensitive isoform X1 [Drosophila navojoa]